MTLDVTFWCLEADKFIKNWMLFLSWSKNMSLYLITFACHQTTGMR